MLVSPRAAIEYAQLLGRTASALADHSLVLSCATYTPEAVNGGPEWGADMAESLRVDLAMLIEHGVPVDPQA